MEMLHKAMQESTNTRIEWTEFQLTSLDMLNKRLREFVRNANDEEREKVQDLLEMHIKAAAENQAQLVMLKMMSVSFNKEEKDS